MNIRKEYDKYFLSVYGQVDFVPLRAKGSRLYGENDEEVIDFSGGIAANCLGHAHPQLIHALNEQAHQMWHVGNTMVTAQAVTLAKKLIDNTCFDKAFLCNSGAEAVEAGLKLARRYAITHFGSHKNKIISFYRSFHGRTLFTASVGGQPKYWEGFDPLPGGITHGIFNDINCIEGLINFNTAVVIVEPIQSEGGLIPAHKKFLARLRTLCDKYNCALMFDEVQTGMGRTGDLFAYMGYGIEPDIISVSKSLGGGFPLGGILVKEPFTEGFSLGTHGTTFGGNPLACAVANKVFDLVNTPEVLEGVKEKHQVFVNELTKINQELDLYKEIRGKGLMLGAELKEEYHGRAREIVHLGFKHGVAVLNASPDVTRFLPSLIIPNKDIKLGMERLYNALQVFKQTAGG